MFMKVNISWIAVIIIVLLLVASVSGTEDFSVLPLNKVIKFKASPDNELAGAQVKVTRRAGELQMKLITPEMEVDTNPNAEPIGYDITADPATRLFTIKEEAVPVQVVQELGVPSAIEGVDVWDPPESTFVLPDSVFPASIGITYRYWYSITTMALTEDPPPINTDLCKTWTKTWVARDWNDIYGWDCYLSNPLWDYITGWAGNPTALGTHWFIRKDVEFTPTYELLYFPDVGYSDWFVHFKGLGVYWNSDFMKKSLTTTAKHYPNILFRVGNSCGAVVYRGILTVVYLGEGHTLLHTHWYMQGVKKY